MSNQKLARLVQNQNIQSKPVPMNYNGLISQRAHIQSSNSPDATAISNRILTLSVKFNQSQIESLTSPVKFNQSPRKSNSSKITQTKFKDSKTS